MTDTDSERLCKGCGSDKFEVDVTTTVVRSDTVTLGELRGCSFELNTVKEGKIEEPENGGDDYDSYADSGYVYCRKCGDSVMVKKETMSKNEAEVLGNAGVKPLVFENMGFDTDTIIGMSTEVILGIASRRLGRVATGFHVTNAEGPEIMLEVYYMGMPVTKEVKTWE